MKLLFENWRKYLLNERYSIKDSLEALSPTNKKMYKVYKRYNNFPWHWEVERGWLDPKEEPPPSVPEEKINKAAAGYRSYILDVIPQDIWGQNAITPEQKKREADKNQGIAIMWLRKLSIENPKIARDIIDGDVYQGKYNDIMPDLEIYFQNLDLMPKRNLIEIGSIEELHQIVKEAKEEIRARQDKRQYLDAGEGTEVLSGKYERNEETKKLERTPGKSGWFIAAIHNKGAACELGKATDWCTATDLDYFEEYYKPDDPLFFFEDHREGAYLGARFQFHYGSEQFMDESDRHVDDFTFKHLHGLLMQTEALEKYKVVQIHHYEMVAEDRSTPPEELAAVAERPNMPESILTIIAKNPSTPLETLEKLARSDNKFIKRAVQVNSALDMGLAIEIFVNNPTDPLIYGRGQSDVFRFMNDGKITPEQALQIVDKVKSMRGQGRASGTSLEMQWMRSQKDASEEKPVEDITHLYERWKKFF